MNHELENGYILVSPKKDIIEFIESNENVIEILNAIRPHLLKHFPNSSFSLELCGSLPWTTEEKLLVNVGVSLKLPRLVEAVDFLEFFLENLLV